MQLKKGTAMLKLKELRKEKNMLQKDIATILHRSITTICDWERGKSEPSIDDLSKLADILEVSVDYLIGRSDDLGMIEVTNELPSDEIELVNLYRLLSNSNKNKLIGFAQGLYSSVVRKF